MNYLRALPLIVGFLLVGGAASPAFAQKSTCKDVPIRWFIYPVATLSDDSTVPSAITGDGNWYSAASGTSNTVIHVCGDNPTRDATVALSSKRTIGLTFGAPITGTATSDSITGSFRNGGFMNVRNILCVGCAKAPFEPFTTRMTLQLYMLANRSDYRLRFMPNLADAPDRMDPALIAAENAPYESSPVQVLPQPYDCNAGGTTKPSWIVRGTVPSADAAVAAAENLQVGSLARITSKGARIAAGQYSMPFEMRIEALSCFAY